MMYSSLPETYWMNAMTDSFPLWYASDVPVGPDETTAPLASVHGSSTLLSATPLSSSSVLAVTVPSAASTNAAPGHLRGARKFCSSHCCCSMCDVDSDRSPIDVHGT